jgi:hypothetical protein
MRTICGAALADSGASSEQQHGLAMVAPMSSQQECIACAHAIRAASWVHDIEVCTAKQYRNIAAVNTAEKIRFDIYNQSSVCDCKTIVRPQKNFCCVGAKKFARGRSKASTINGNEKANRFVRIVIEIRG